MNKIIISCIICFLCSFTALGQSFLSVQSKESVAFQTYVSFRKPFNEPFISMYNFGFGAGGNVVYRIGETGFFVGGGASYNRVNGVVKQEDILKVYFPNLNILNYFAVLRYSLGSKVSFQAELGGSSWLSVQRQDYYYVTPVLGCDFYKGFGASLAIPVTFKHDRDPQRFGNFEFRLTKAFGG